MKGKFLVSVLGKAVEGIWLKIGWGNANASEKNSQGLCARMCGQNQLANAENLCVCVSGFELTVRPILKLKILGLWGLKDRRRLGGRPRTANKCNCHSDHTECQRIIECPPNSTANSAAASTSFVTVPGFST